MEVHDDDPAADQFPVDLVAVVHPRRRGVERFERLQLRVARDRPALVHLREDRQGGLPRVPVGDGPEARCRVPGQVARLGPLDQPIDHPDEGVPLNPYAASLLGPDEQRPWPSCRSSSSARSFRTGTQAPRPFPALRADVGARDREVGPGQGAVRTSRPAFGCRRSGCSEFRVTMAPHYRDPWRTSALTKPAHRLPSPRLSDESGRDDASTGLRSAAGREEVELRARSAPTWPGPRRTPNL